MLNESGEIVLALSSLSPMQRTAPRVNFDTDRVRTLIAEYIGVDAKRVTDEARFSDDLGLDWFGRLELMILIEDEVCRRSDFWKRCHSDRCRRRSHAYNDFMISEGSSRFAELGAGLYEWRMRDT